LDLLVPGLNFSPYPIWMEWLMAIEATIQRPKCS